MAKMGRPPLPKEERGKRVTLYLSAEALAALHELSPEGRVSELVQGLLIEAAERKRQDRPKR